MSTGAKFPYQYLTAKTGRIDFYNVYTSPRLQKIVDVRYVYLTIKNKQAGVSYKAVVNVGGKTVTMSSSASSTTGTQYWACNVAISDIQLTGRYVDITLQAGTSSNVEIRSDLSDISAVNYYYKTQRASDVIMLDNDISKPIRVQVLTNDTTSNKKLASITEFKSGETKTYYSNVNSDIVTIPPRTLTQLNISKIEAKNGYYESWDTGNIDGLFGLSVIKNDIALTQTLPAIQNFKCTSSSVDRQISYSWESFEQKRYEFEAYQNGQLIYSKKENNATTTSVFNGNLLVNTNQITAKLRIAYIPTGYEGNEAAYTYSEWKELVISPHYDNPTLTNLNTIGEFYEKAITVNWRSEYQTGYEWEAYYNNDKVAQGNGANLKEFVIPANTFTGVLSASVRVRVKREVAGQTLWSNWAEKNITLKEIEPTLNNLALSGSNIDLPISFSWVSTDQQNYEVQIVKDDIVVNNYSGTTDTSIDILPSSLTIGLHKFRVRVAYNGRWTPWMEITATLIETLPSIGAFEPDGVIVERDNPIRVWWTSNNQSKWRLVIDESLTYNGTDTQALILSPATLQTGTHSMVLTVTYVTGAGIEKHTSKKAEFIVQGKPPIPTITNVDAFNSNRPIITWDTQEQQGYLLEVLKGGSIVYSTDWKNGLVTQHKVLDYLENGTYTVRIKIINQFGLESDYGSKVITITGTEASNINLLVRNEGSYTKLIWDNTGDKFRTFYIIRNGNVIAKVDGTEYIDYTCNHENTYIVRGINSSDVFKDSNSVIVNVSIMGGLLATIDRLEDMINVGISRNSNEFGGNIDISHSLIHLTGRELPVGVFGEHRSGTYTLKFSTKDNLFRFLDMCYRRKVFCYRDKRQTLYLTIPNPQYSIDKFGMQYTVHANEIDYNEVIAYD